MLRRRGATYFNTVPADGAAYEGENRYHDLNRYRNQLEISVNKLTMAGVRNRSKSQPSPCGIRSAITSPDREVETVMHRQYSSHSCRASPQTGSKLRHSGPPRPATSSADDFRSQVGSRLSGLIQEGPRKSAFSPYKPTTVLTNLQRGNVETQTPVVIPDLSIHQLAAQGELFIDEDNRTYDLELRDENGFTPIMWCCAYGQVPALRTLLKYKVDINACGNRGENALLLASCNGHVEIIRVLLEQNMDVNYADQVSLQLSRIY